MEKYGFITVDEYIEKENIDLKGPLHVTKVNPSLVNDLKLRFLSLFMQCGLIEEVCAQMGISPGTVYQWRREDDYFATEWDRIRREELLPILEDKAFKSVMNGEKTDTGLLMFLLKAYHRKQYDDKFVETEKKKDGYNFSLTDATKNEKLLPAPSEPEILDDQRVQQPQKTKNDREG